jgi:hypothetical protein
MGNKTPKKSPFISKQIRELNTQEIFFCENIKKVLCDKSEAETIGYASKSLSCDGKERPFILSREIVDKIESDHGAICPENMIINVFDWDYATTNVLGNPDKINLIKSIPDSNNYLLIAAIRINGFFMLTHFETETKGDINLKRLLKRGNAVSRGPSIGL